MQTPDGIEMREGPTGPRAAIVGGPDVWEIVMSWRTSERSVATTAELLGLDEVQVQAAIDFYEADPDEIDERLERLHAGAEALLRGDHELTAPEDLKRLRGHA